MQWKAIYFNEEYGKKNQTESKRLKSNKCSGRKVRKKIEQIEKN